jgi:hypothetical protein
MKYVFRCLALLTAAAALAAPVWAQEAKKAEKPKSEGAAMAMQAPKAAPEMTKLIKLMAGSWNVTEVDEASPMMPKGGKGKGTATFTPGPGGMSLTEKYHSSGSMGPNFSGMGTFWWSSKDQAYRGLWCDNMTPDGCDGSGSTKWSGDKLIGMMESEMNGQKMATRFTYSDFKPDSFVMMMEMGPNQNQMQKAMTITYSKGVAAKVPEKP